MNKKELGLLKENLTGRITPSDTLDKIIDTIANLHQIKAIEYKDALSWFNTILDGRYSSISTPEETSTQILWHAKRLRGFGGSDIGVLVEESGAFDTPRSIIMSKLMKLPPDEPGEHTLRGTILEDMVIDTAIKRLSVANPTFKHIVNPDSIPDDVHPWLIGNPDFVFEIEGKRYIADIKVPNHKRAEVIGSGRCPMEYASQLHHYAMCQFGSSEVDHEKVALGLIPYDFGIAEPDITSSLKSGLATGNITRAINDVIAKAESVIDNELHPYDDGVEHTPENNNNIAHAKFNYIPVPVSDTLIQSMLDAGDKYFNMLVKGEIPEASSDKKITITDEHQVYAAEKAARLRLTAKALQEEADAIVASIKDDVTDMGQHKEAYVVGPVSIGKPAEKLSIIDEKHAVALAGKLKIPASLYRPVNKTALIDELAKMLGKPKLIKDGVIQQDEGTARVTFPRANSKLRKVIDVDVELSCDAVDKVIEGSLGATPEEPGLE